MKPSYITRRIKDSARYLVIEIDGEGYESVIAECASKHFAELIADALNQTTLEA
jgi:hypothetical protein